MNIILFGGAFNPVHRGHLYIAEKAAETYPDYKILFVPSRLSPHKNNESMIAPRHRIHMLRLALKGTPFMLEPWETERSGISYTIKTVKYLYKKYNPEKKPIIMIGDDLLPILHTWRKVEELKQIAEFLVFRRELNPPLLSDKGFSIHYLDNNIKTVSSTDLRIMISRGEDPADLLPTGVYDYIKEKNLYKANT
ncbi:MAG: nicotinate (nicotinamide) nucleotide adenylyltransferase [Spirochaetae bacterium HGW-Spirochaetae-1]|jgi:nicotinate-nucleotide adenylyltransferase|nr:MAG: nicotinate (nicotinamide) nucleotide adenylyltransferase [Spirochaetae bacterium HGW-Spirochaetae-1]